MNDDTKTAIYVKEIALQHADRKAKLSYINLITAEITAHVLREELKVLKGEK